MQNPPELDDDSQKREGMLRRHFSIRINMFFFVTFVLFSTLIIKLAYLQFVEGPALKAEKREVTQGKVYIPPVRGNIYDVKGAPIATSRSTQTLFMQLSKDDTYEELLHTAKMLEKVFAMYGSKTAKPLTAEEIFKLMDTEFNYDESERAPKDYFYSPRRIKSGLTNDEIAYISEHRDELTGLDISEESIREYEEDPTKQVAVQLVGYLRKFSGVTGTDKKGDIADFYRNKKEEEGYEDREYVGVDGLEYLYQDELRGVNGMKVYPVNSRNQIIGDAEITYPEKGKNLYLTIDRDVQLAAQNAIKETLETLNKSNRKYESDGKNAKMGYAVAMEVDTGRVVAMASYPDYQPVEWENMTDEKYMSLMNLIPNGAIRDRRINSQDNKLLARSASSLVPLGSTIKPLSVLLGLREGLFTPYDTYYDSGLLTFGKDGSGRVTNSENHGAQSLTPSKAIEVSSNTFMAKMVGLNLYDRFTYYQEKGTTPLDVWDKYMKAFGLGVSTESGLPFESVGVRDYVEDKSSSTQSVLVMSSFGQGAKYTTLQLAQYASMLANRGSRLKPLFVDRITTYDNKVVHTYKDDVKVLNTEKFTDQQWNTVISGMKSGVEGFDDFPISFARKTGTSQSFIAGRTDLLNATFITFAPVEKPKLAIAVVVPEGGYGRYGAAPIARKIYDAYFGFKPKTDEGTTGKETTPGTNPATNTQGTGAQNAANGGIGGNGGNGTTNGAGAAGANTGNTGTGNGQKQEVADGVFRVNP
ncbi:peptidoglycan D,D-transpeptidase FtsI family protein [Gorillibacterium timonense]|uniref:peptidoglycan D,D-transpeptidase FtsI family protein n=1 Tax=Gorillibacterium timonense TaxID=1689269 RepID=UPI0009E8C1CF|nr:penicillin-binding transpeptidase domain-containing protein [Gorillibacterium timonense]